MKVRKGVFYSRKLDNFVVDSMCVCGHLESEHGSLNKTVNKRIVRHPGHGNCRSGSCACPRFTWARHVTADEVADRIIAARGEATASA